MLDLHAQGCGEGTPRTGKTGDLSPAGTVETKITIDAVVYRAGGRLLLIHRKSGPGYAGATAVARGLFQLCKGR